MSRKLKKTRKNKDFDEIFGIHAVQAAINNKLRKHQKIIISQNIKHLFLKNIKKKVNEITILTNKEFSRIYGNEINHQGVILITTKLKQPDLDEVIEKSKKKNKDIVIMLDQVTDPQNIGSIMRSCALFDCNSLIVTKTNAPDITPHIAKTASGALEVVNYVKVTNLSQAIDKFKRNNFWVLGFDSNYNKIENNFKLQKKCLLVFGAEGKGLRELTIRKCDQILTIPINYNYEFGMESLNVSSACTIALYEHFKFNDNF